MRANNLLFIFLVIAIIFVLINISITFIKIYNFKKDLIGYASGYVNIAINTLITINMSRDTVNWSSGMINSSFGNATLYTSGENAGIVLRGNWSGANAKAFIIENIGNVNSSLSIQTSKNAHDFFNSTSSSNEEYMLNVTDKEIGSCINSSALGIWQDVNKTSGGTKFCSQFSFRKNSNEIYIDILITVPSDSGNVGEQFDTITIIGDAVN